jgi:hypothetical protein
MSHYVSSKPFYILTGVPNSMTILYGANEVGNEIVAPDAYGLEEFDEETLFADRIDEIVGIDGWYWLCENRVPSPPNPNPWDPFTDCVDGGSDS